MMYALLLYCVVSTTDQLDCAVGYTDLSAEVSTMSQCLAKARRVQANIMARTLRDDPSLKPGMQEVYCGTREQIIVKAADEYNKFRKYKVYADFFEFG